MPEESASALIPIALSEKQWQVRARAHEENLGPLVEAVVDRRSRQIKDPTEDFLWEYYEFGPRQLLRWSPGLGYLLQGAAAQRFTKTLGFVAEPEGVRVDPSVFPQRKRPWLDWLRNLLVALDERPPSFGCSGMHEWAMVYRDEKRRHPQLELRVPDEEIGELLENLGLACTHYDASRFFTEAARPFHLFALSQAGRVEHEQCGCLHANMDLYRWASRLFPWTSSDLVTEAFQLASRIREVDMRASPYDLAACGLSPILVETEDGRREYREMQALFSSEAEPIRARIRRTVDCVLDSVF